MARDYQCTASAMAFYLFLRFQIICETWPDFSNIGWQEIKLLHSRTDPKKKLSYSAQNLAIKTAFLNHDIKLKSWTHLGRPGVSWVKHLMFQMHKSDD